MAKLKLAALAPMIDEQVQALNSERNRALYRAREIPRADAVKDIDRRFRWDILWSIPREIRHTFFDEAKALGATDNHIDSLLKSLVADL